jgi:hypothetical protein
VWGLLSPEAIVIQLTFHTTLGKIQRKRSRKFKMTTISPFTITVPDAQIDQLHKKLEQATFPDEFDDAGWDMGVPLAEMKRLVTVWREKFDRRAQEKKLNEQLHQYTMPISVDGIGELDIHVIHHRSGNPNAIPLLFIHGCRLYFCCCYFDSLFSRIS